MRYRLGMSGSISKYKQRLSIIRICLIWCISMSERWWQLWQELEVSMGYVSFVGSPLITSVKLLGPVYVGPIVRKGIWNWPRNSIEVTIRRSISGSKFSPISNSSFSFSPKSKQEES